MKNGGDLREYRVIDENNCQLDVKVFGNLPLLNRRGLQKGSVIRAFGVVSSYDGKHPRYLKIDCKNGGKFKVLDKNNSAARQLLSCIGRGIIVKESKYPPKSVAELRKCADGTYSVANCIVRRANYEPYDGCVHCSRKVVANQPCTNERCAKLKKKSKKCLRLGMELADNCEDHGIGETQWVTAFGGNVTKKMMNMAASTFLNKSPRKQAQVVGLELEGRQFSYIEVQVTTNKDRNNKKNFCVNDFGKKYRP